MSTDVLWGRVGSITARLAGAKRAPQPPRTILVVDDEEPIRKLVDRALSSAGYTVVLAANGPEAMRVAADSPSLDLLVTDMIMPGMNGSEVARRLRQDHQGLKVLYFTAFSDRLFDEKVALWDDEAFLEKPCSVKGLLEAVSVLWSDRIVSAPLNQSAEARLAVKHILLVDDDSSVLNLFSRALSEYDVTLAHDGFEALAVSKRLEQLDLLITDYCMPSMIGDELIARVREQWPELPVLVVTGHAGILDRDASHWWQALAHLEKPFHAEALREQVSALIGAAHQADH